MCGDQNLAKLKRNREDCLIFDPRAVNLAAQLIDEVCLGPNALYHLLFCDQSPPSPETSINTTRESTIIFVLACYSTTKVMEFENKSKVSGYVATAEPGHVGSHVAEKYRGSAADRREMEMMGKQQVLRVSAFIFVVMRWMLISESQRNFHFATMFGFASMVIASWEMLLECVSPR